jgi:hypothetical protein
MRIKTEYQQEMQRKLAAIRHERCHGTMSANTYAIYRFAYLMTEAEARKWNGQ